MKEFDAGNIKKYLESNENQFMIFDMPYTEKEKKCIDNFDLKIELTYNNYGDNDLNDLNIFLIQLGDNNQKKIKRMGQIIKNITKIVLSGYLMESYWLTIRVTQPTNVWNLPRWHCDGNYFYHANEREIVSKFATSLHGSGTLLMKTSDSQRKDFIDLIEESYQKNNDGMSKEHRKHMNDNISGIAIKPTNYQSVIFISGPREICGIHSEPEMNTPRMFLSIVPGSKNEINKWRNKRGGGHSYLDNSIYSDYVLNKKNYINIRKMALITI